MLGTALDADHAGHDIFCIMCVADHCREDCKGRNIGFHVIAAVHGELIMFSCHRIKSNHFFWIDGKGLKFLVSVSCSMSQ